VGLLRIYESTAAALIDCSLAKSNGREMAVEYGNVEEWPVWKPPSRSSVPKRIFFIFFKLKLITILGQ
jgi:hypothetical protein